MATVDVFLHRKEQLVIGMHNRSGPYQLMYCSILDFFTVKYLTPKGL